jgi:hypothetical protein
MQITNDKLTNNATFSTILCLLHLYHLLQSKSYRYLLRGFGPLANYAEVPALIHTIPTRHFRLSSCSSFMSK